MIDVNDITVRIGSKVLLDHTSAHISDGQKIGLVGANGCGKSTLFKVLKGELETESGSVYFPTSYKVVFVEQELNDVNQAILEFVLSQDKERMEVLNLLETADEMEIGEVHERLNSMNAAAAPAKAASILNGLGFSNDDLYRPIKEFSGGWRMRLALAAALFQPSDVLLLDEPTNHLDLEASLWLESHLRKYKGTLVLISHDKYILNDLCNYIIHIENFKLNTYSGNYDTFQNTRAMQRELLSKQAVKQEKHRQHVQSYIDRFRYKASKAKQAQSRIKMLEKMEVVSAAIDDRGSHFDFPQPANLPPPLLTIEDVSVGYDGKAILKDLNFSLIPNDRIALLGANGNGKSTFAKLVSNRLQAMEGTVRRPSKLKVGYFAQHQSDELPMDETATEFMSRLMPDKREPQVRAHLARFGLDNEKSLTIIEKLSGGEKARLLFAAMTYDAPALLILDEPTNHLDIDGREALILALNEYEGAVILITHDLHLIELIADDLWLVKDGCCKSYTGDINDYKKLLLEERAPSPKAKKDDKPKLSGKEERKLALAKRTEKNMMKTQISKLEQKIEGFNRQRETLTLRFNEDLSASNIVNLQTDLSDLDKTIQETEALWLELTEKFSD